MSISLDCPASQELLLLESHVVPRPLAPPASLAQAAAAYVRAVIDPRPPKAGLTRRQRALLTSHAARRQLAFSTGHYHDQGEGHNLDSDQAAAGLHRRGCPTQLASAAADLGLGRPHPGSAAADAGRSRSPSLARPCEGSPACSTPDPQDAGLDGLLGAPHADAAVGAGQGGSAAPAQPDLRDADLADLLSAARADPATQRAATHQRDGLRRALTAQANRLALGMPEQVRAEFGPAMWDSPEHCQLLEGCSLIVGLHPDQARDLGSCCPCCLTFCCNLAVPAGHDLQTPDGALAVPQATDSIVEAANRFGKRMAVVPCCVFPSQHAHRRFLTSDGRASGVRLHAELVEYLAQQAGPLACRDHLRFEGANQVVFRRT